MAQLGISITAKIPNGMTISISTRVNLDSEIVDENFASFMLRHAEVLPTRSN